MVRNLWSGDQNMYSNEVNTVLEIERMTRLALILKIGTEILINEYNGPIT